MAFHDPKNNSAKGMAYLPSSMTTKLFVRLSCLIVTSFQIFLLGCFKCTKNHQKSARLSDYEIPKDLSKPVRPGNSKKGSSQSHRKIFHFLLAGFSGAMCDSLTCTWYPSVHQLLLAEL